MKPNHPAFRGAMLCCAAILTSNPSRGEDSAGRIPAPPPDAREVDWVNPFIGAITESRKIGSASRGKTFPGAATP